MRFIRIITALSALAAVSACAMPEPMVPVTTSAPTVTPPPPAAPMATDNAATDDAALPPSPVVVHFHHGKADITGSTMQVLWGLAPSLKAAAPAVIRIQGFTDASGKAAYNKILSEKRAQAVAEQLRKLGVTARVEVVGQGIVKGGRKGAKDAAARRVEISWEPASPAKTSAVFPGSPDTLASQAGRQDLGAISIAAAVPATDAAEAASCDGFAPAASGSPLVMDRAATFEATGPPVLPS